MRRRERERELRGGEGEVGIINETKKAQNYRNKIHLDKSPGSVVAAAAAVVVVVGAFR